MSHGTLERRVEALESRTKPAQSTDAEQTFLEILTVDELKLLQRFNAKRASGASDEEAIAVLGDALPEIDLKWKLANDVIEHGTRLDEYDQLYQAVQFPWNGPKEGGHKA